MCGNNMSVPLLAEAVTVSGLEKETAAVSKATAPGRASLNSLNLSEYKYLTSNIRYNTLRYTDDAMSY